MRHLISLLLCAVTLLLAGCQTTYSPDQMAARAAMNEAIKNEPAGNYFIGRRLYKTEFKMWGYVRKPGQPWSQAELVMFNEQKKLIPDREQGKMGYDNNYEYRLEGYFTGEKVYEPASNGFYPEFVLTGYQLRSISGPPIYRDPKIAKPEVRMLPSTM